MVFNFSDHASILGSYIAEIRDEQVQKDALRFRLNMERIAEIMGYELSKNLAYSSKEIITPLGISSCNVLFEQPVLITILRAGLAMHQGLMRTFDKADSAFISAYRKHSSPEDFEIFVEYLAAPPLDNKIWIISDPMLATGNSMLAVYNTLKINGAPKKLIIVSAIASSFAIESLKNQLPPNTEFWVGAIDDELTAQSYIVPGLGDAGDLAFGIKV